MAVVLAFLSRVPKEVWVGLAAGLALMVALWAIDRNGYNRAMEKCAAERAQEKLEWQRQIDAEKERQQKVITETVIEYRDRVKVVKEKGDEIIREVPVFVPADLPLPGAVRVLHDAAARGALPTDTAGAVAAAPAVEAAALTETVAANYASCLAEFQKLEALQKIVSTLGVK